MNYQEKVKEFQLASGQPVSNVLYTLSKDEYDFRDSLLREEIRELQYALIDQNRVEVLDALCDIKYVNDGTANMMGRLNEPLDDCWFYDESWCKDLDGLIYGLNNLLVNEVEAINCQTILIAQCLGFSRENFETALERVHASNMSKFCLDIKTAERTQEFYKNQGIETYIEPRNKMTVVYRKGDGKVLKSVEYHPVYLEDLV